MIAFPIVSYPVVPKYRADVVLPSAAARQFRNAVKNNIRRADRSRVAQRRATRLRLDASVLPMLALFGKRSKTRVYALAECTRLVRASAAVTRRALASGESRRLVAT